MHRFLFSLQQIQQTHVPFPFLALLFLKEKRNLFLPIAPICHLVAGKRYFVLFLIAELLFELDCLFGVVRLVIRNERFFSIVILVFLFEVIVVVQMFQLNFIFHTVFTFDLSKDLTLV
jgi:hypothetical protein